MLTRVRDTSRLEHEEYFDVSLPANMPNVLTHPWNTEDRLSQVVYSPTPSPPQGYRYNACGDGGWAEVLQMKLAG